MIELTDRQLSDLETPFNGPARIVNPRTHETFVLVPVDEYERMKAEEYDDSPWSSEERYTLAWEAGKRAGWDEMDEYDNIPEKS